MKTALIFWGGWDGHQPDACAAIIANWLAQDGFQPTVAEGTAVLAERSLAGFSLIVPIVTMSKIEKAEADALCRAVEGGVGLAGFHGGLGDSFRDCVDYQFMVGGQWVAHPGNIIDYRVNVTRPDDPVMKGIGDFDYRSEQYYMHTDPSNEVLATTTFTGDHASWIKGVVMPVVWKRRHGAGRVFYSSLGHQAAELSHPQMATILRRGMLWAAGQDSVGPSSQD
ncbi:MAG: ThuA domain-containing protein [Paracoccaceae bacterium]